MKLAKLNKEETQFAKDIAVITTVDEEILNLRQFKTFFRELNKIEKKHGYDPTKVSVTNLIGYFGEYHYEVIEEYVYCFKNNLKEGAKRYFETYY